MNKPVLFKIRYEFYQPGNTDGTTDDTEELVVEVESIVDIEKEGGYFVLRTTTGWSINDSSELVDIINRVKQGIRINEK